VAGLGSLSSFVSGLRAGETGCLSGTFSESVSVSTGGFVLRSVSGQRAVLKGRFSISRSAADVRLESLSFDAANVTTFSQLYVNGDRVTLRDLDIDGAGRVNCILAGAGGASNSAEWAVDLVIEKSRIHHCGDNSHEHAIYAEFTDRLRISDSYLYAAGGYGLHFYPHAQNSLVEYTLIDSNARGTGWSSNVTFSGEAAGGEYSQGYGSRNNRILNSLITNSTQNYNVESYFPTGSLDPAGNEVAFSCLFNAPKGNFDGSDDYSRHDNKLSDPLFVNRSNYDYRLQSGSPCTGWGPR
jgi:hypothetical protein